MKFYFLLFSFFISATSHAISQGTLIDASAKISHEEDSYKENILIATHIEPPYVYLENETFRGSNVDIIRLLASRMNKTVEFISCPFARCLAMTREGQADMMLSLNKSEEREAFLSYLSQPSQQLITPMRFYLHKNSPLKIESYEDLSRLNVGVLRGATYFKHFDEDKELSKVDIKSHTRLVEMLLKNRIDTFLGKESSIQMRVEDDIYENEMKMASYVYNKKSDFYIAISKKSQLNEDVDEFSKVLEQLVASGEINKILAKYQ